jgi:hypothetical protein
MQMQIALCSDTQPLYRSPSLIFLELTNHVGCALSVWLHMSRWVSIINLLSRIIDIEGIIKAVPLKHLLETS